MKHVIFAVKMLENWVCKLCCVLFQIMKIITILTLLHGSPAHIGNESGLTIVMYLHAKVFQS